MDAFHLYNLNLRLKNKDNDCSEHIGLINVAQRLRIIYDIEVPIEVFSQQEKYTLVRIKILKS